MFQGPGRGSISVFFSLWGAGAAGPGRNQKEFILSYTVLCNLHPLLPPGPHSPRAEGAQKERNPAQSSVLDGGARPGACCPEASLLYPAVNRGDLSLPSDRCGDGSHVIRSVPVRFVPGCGSPGARCTRGAGEGPGRCSKNPLTEPQPARRPRVATESAGPFSAVTASLLLGPELCVRAYSPICSFRPKYRVEAGGRRPRGGRRVPLNGPRSRSQAPVPSCPRPRAQGC